MRPDVTVITATGNRPEAFALCGHFLRRQETDARIQWVVVDDGDTPGSDREVELFRTGGNLATLIRPEPRWRMGQNTLGRNLLAALPEAQADNILFFEDDDYYTSDYLERMRARLKVNELVGEIPSRYYYVPARCFRDMRSGTYRASLCQTGMRASLIPTLHRICAQNSRYIDVSLWQAAPDKATYEDVCCVGIKGLPGRAGIGIGHRPDFGSWTSDRNLSVFKAWVGSDWELYRRFM